MKCIFMGEYGSFGFDFVGYGRMGISICAEVVLGVKEIFSEGYYLRNALEMHLKCISTKRYGSFKLDFYAGDE